LRAPALFPLHPVKRGEKKKKKRGRGNHTGKKKETIDLLSWHGSKKERVRNRFPLPFHSGRRKKREEWRSALPRRKGEWVQPLLFPPLLCRQRGGEKKVVEKKGGGSGAARHPFTYHRILEEGKKGGGGRESRKKRTGSLLSFPISKGEGKSRGKGS